MVYSVCQHKKPLTNWKMYHVPTCNFSPKQSNSNSLASRKVQELRGTKQYTHEEWVIPQEYLGKLQKKAGGRNKNGTN